MTVEQVVFTLTANVHPYLNSIGVAQSRLIGMLAGAQVAVAAHSIKLAAEFERTTVAFEVMAGNAAEGKKLIEEIQQMAVESPFKSQELADIAKQQKSFGTANKDIMDTLHALGEVSAGTGTSMERIGLAFGQVRVAGKLLGTELRQFVDAGIPLIENLAAVMKRPKESIRALVEQGHVGFAQVVMAFNRMTMEGGIYAGLMERINKTTLIGRWQNFSENLEIVARNFTKAALDGIGLNDLLTRMADNLQSLRAGGQSGTFTFFQNVGNGINFAYQMAVKLVDQLEGIYNWSASFVSNNSEMFIAAGAVLAIAAAVNTLALSAQAAAWAFNLMLTGRLARIAGIALSIFDLTRMLNLLRFSFALLQFPVGVFTVAAVWGLRSLAVAAQAASFGVAQLAYQMTLVSLRAGFAGAATFYTALSRAALVLSRATLLATGVPFMFTMFRLPLVAMYTMTAYLVRFRLLAMSAAAALRSLALLRMAASFGPALASGISSVVSSVMGSAVVSQGLPLAIIAAMGYALGKAGVFDGVRKDAYDTFVQIGQDWTGLWAGLKGAFDAGDVSATFRILAAGIELTWARLLIEMTVMWKKFTFGISNPTNQASLMMTLGDMGMGAITGVAGIFDEETAKKWEERGAARAQGIRDQLEQMKKTDPKFAEFAKSLDEYRKKETEGLQPLIDQANAAASVGLELKKADDVSKWMKEHSEDIFKARMEYIKWAEAIGLAGTRVESFHAKFPGMPKGEELAVFLGNDAGLSAQLKSSKAMLDRAVSLRNIAEDLNIHDPRTYPAPKALSDIYEQLRSQSSSGAFSALPFAAFDNFQKRGIDSMDKLVGTMSPQLQRVGRMFQDQFKLEGLTLPSSVFSSMNKLGAMWKGIFVPESISGAARDSANKLIKDINNGVGPLDDFRIEYGRLREAFLGPQFAESNRNFVGPPAMDEMGKFKGAVLNQGQFDFGVTKFFDKMAKANVMERALPPALLSGSSEAQEVINKNQTRQLDTQEGIKAVLEEMLFLEKEASKHREKTADALSKMQNSGGLLKFLVPLGLGDANIPIN